MNRRWARWLVALLLASGAMSFANSSEAQQINLQTQVKGIISANNGGTGVAVTSATNGCPLITAGTWAFSPSYCGLGSGGVQFTPTATQTVAQPAGTTLAVSSLNNVLNATLFAGADLGAQVQAAATQLNGACGEIDIPLGTYTWSTTATLSHCQTLTGNAIINVTAMTTPALVIASPVNTGNTALYKHGSVSHLTFVGPAPADTSGASWTSPQIAQIGIYLGADPAGVITPSNYVSYLTDFSDLYITGFGCGFNIANGSQFAFFGGTEYLNYNNICFSNSAGVENVNFTGNQNLAAVQYGIYQPTSAAFVQLNIDSTSIDYNGQNFTGGQGIHMSNVALSMAKSYFEGPLRSTQIEAGYNGDVISVKSTRFNFVNTTGYPNLPSIFVVDGSNMTFDIDDITAVTAFASPMGSIVELVNWQAVGAYNQLYNGTYYYANPFTKEPLPLTQTAPNIQFYRTPTVDANGNTNGLNVNGLTLGVPYAASTPTITALTDGAGSGVPYDSRLTFTPTGIYLQGKDMAHASFNTQILSSTFYYPESASTAPTGACANAGVVSMTADGKGVFCNLATGQWTTVYSSATNIGTVLPLAAGSANPLTSPLYTPGIVGTNNTYSTAINNATVGTSGDGTLDTCTSSYGNFGYSGTIGGFGICEQSSIYPAARVLTFAAANGPLAEVANAIIAPLAAPGTSGNYSVVYPDTSGVWGTPTIVAASSALSPVFPLTGTTPAIAAANGYFTITLSGPTTPTISGIAAGQKMTFEICQPGGAAYAWNWPAAFHTPMTVGTALGLCSIQEFISTNGTSLVPNGEPGLTGVTP